MQHDLWEVADGDCDEDIDVAEFVSLNDGVRMEWALTYGLYGEPEDIEVESVM